MIRDAQVDAQEAVHNLAKLSLSIFHCGVQRPRRRNTSVPSICLYTFTLMYPMEKNIGFTNFIKILPKCIIAKQGYIGVDSKPARANHTPKHTSETYPLMQHALLIPEFSETAIYTFTLMCSIEKNMAFQISFQNVLVVSYCTSSP